MTGPAHLSRLSVSRLLAEDLEGAEKRRAEDHLLACPDCARLFAEARGQASAFAEKYPSREYLAATRRSRRRAPEAAPTLWSRLRRSLWAGGGVRAAFASLVILASALGVMRLVGRAPALGDPAAKGAEDLTAKGGLAAPSLEAARFLLFRNGAPVEADTLAARAGDTLQLGIVSARAVHYSVLYRDDGGPLEAYFPPDPGRRAGSSRGENLPNSLVLDAGWAVETLYCLWSHRPFTPEEAAGAAAGSPPADIGSHVFLIRNSRP